MSYAKYIQSIVLREERQRKAEQQPAPDVRLTVDGEIEHSRSYGRPYANPLYRNGKAGDSNYRTLQISDWQKKTRESSEPFRFFS